MKAILFLPFYQTGDFANDEKQISDEEYAQMLNNYFSSDYYKFMNNAINGFFDERYQMMDVMPEKYQVKSVKEKVTPTKYFTFDIDFNDMEDQPIDGVFLNRLCRQPSMTAFFIHVHPEDEVNSDGLSEMAFWVRESKQIMSDPRIDDERKLGMLSPKDLRLAFTEEINGINYDFRYELKGCRVVDQDDRNNFAIIVNKIEKI